MANLVTFAKKLWKDKVGGNTPITAAELNRMEQGVSDCATQINRLGDSVSRIRFIESDTKLTISYTEDSGFQIGIQGTPFHVWFSKKKGIGIWDSSERRNYMCNFDTIQQHSVGQVNLNGCKLAVTANQGWFGIYVRGHEMPSFGMEVNEEGAIVRFVKDGKAFKTLQLSVSRSIWGKSISVELRTDSYFALVLSANDSEKLIPFFIWRSGAEVATTTLPAGYSVTRDGNIITVSRANGATFVVYVYNMG